MSLPGWDIDPNTRTPCATDKESWSCPHMKAVKDDFDMCFEHYHCQVCGRRESLDYDEMR